MRKTVAKQIDSTFLIILYPVVHKIGTRIFHNDSIHVFHNRVIRDQRVPALWNVDPFFIWLFYAVSDNNCILRWGAAVRNIGANVFFQRVVYNIRRCGIFNQNSLHAVFFYRILFHECVGVRSKSDSCSAVVQYIVVNDFGSCFSARAKYSVFSILLYCVRSDNAVTSRFVINLLYKQGISPITSIRIPSCMFFLILLLIIIGLVDLQSIPIKLFRKTLPTILGSVSRSQKMAGPFSFHSMWFLYSFLPSHTFVLTPWSNILQQKCQPLCCDIYCTR